MGLDDIHIHVHVHEDDPEVLARIEALETAMANQIAELTALQTQFTEFREDLSARLGELTTRIEELEAAQGEFTPEAQAVLDTLKADVQAAVDQVGDADTDGNPVPPPTP